MNPFTPLIRFKLYFCSSSTNIPAHNSPFVSFQSAGLLYLLDRVKVQRTTFRKFLVFTRLQTQNFFFLFNRSWSVWKRTAHVNNYFEKDISSVPCSYGHILTASQLSWIVNDVFYLYITLGEADFCASASIVHYQTDSWSRKTNRSRSTRPGNYRYCVQFFSPSLV